MSGRPAVDVVVPFAGDAAALADLVRRGEQLELGPADTLRIVDNTRVSNRVPPATRATVVPAPQRQSSYFARNVGARAGRNPWLLFFDADVEPPADLVERYFDQPPGERTAVLAGAVVDEPLDPSGPQSPVARYTMLRASMSQANTLRDGPYAYAQTANCAVRREAFEAVGGFCGGVRSGGDADLCFRLREAGWAIEPRDGAAAVHRSRTTLRKLLRQRARHGAGAGWLDREYPGSFPRRRWAGLAKWTAQSFGAAVAARAAGRRDDALIATIEPLWVWAFELGRLLPNEVPER